MKLIRRARSDLHKKVAGIASVANIPEIQAKSELINKILNTDYVDNAGINEFEEIREKLRDLMKYIPRGKIKYETNFSDELLSATWKESELENDELKNYKAKAEYYIRQHQDNVAIAKLKTNQPLTETDVETLEAIYYKLDSDSNSPEVDSMSSYAKCRSVDAQSNADQAEPAPVSAEPILDLTEPEPHPAESQLYTTPDPPVESEQPSESD